jgi:spermidine synthase
MSARFEELDWRRTPMGELSLRRRRETVLDVDVYEVRLGEEFLMSSLFTAAEVELARLGLGLASGTDLDVVVGGLGLGFTARAVLSDSRVRSLHVVEAQAAVIEWHQRELLPGAVELVTDPRCRLDLGDFFAAVRGAGFGPDAPSRWHVVLVDIDHTPDHLLHPSHAAFYTAAGLAELTRWLHRDGVFGLWSDRPPDNRFLGLLRGAFSHATAEVVSFPNHYLGGQSTNTVYLAKDPLRQLADGYPTII